MFFSSSSISFLKVSESVPRPIQSRFPNVRGCVCLSSKCNFLFTRPRQFYLKYHFLYFTKQEMNFKFFILLFFQLFVYLLHILRNLPQLRIAYQLKLHRVVDRWQMTCYRSQVTGHRCYVIGNRWHEHKFILFFTVPNSRNVHLSICISPSHVIYFKASYWPWDHMTPAPQEVFLVGFMDCLPPPSAGP